MSETTAAVFKGDTLTPDNGTGATEKIVIENRDSYTKTVDGKEHTIEVIQTNYGTLELDTVTGNYTFTLNGEAQIILLPVKSSLSIFVSQQQTNIMPRAIVISLCM